MSRRGERDHGKERFWRRMVRLWRRSGLKVRAFCAEHAITEASFYAWRRIIAERDQEDTRVHAEAERDAVSADAPAFVPVRVIGVAAPKLEVALPGGQVVHVPAGFDAATLRQLLALLAEEQPC